MITHRHSLKAKVNLLLRSKISSNRNHFLLLDISTNVLRYMMVKFNFAKDKFKILTSGKLANSSKEAENLMLLKAIASHELAFGKLDKVFIVGKLRYFQLKTFSCTQSFNGPTVIDSEALISILTNNISKHVLSNNADFLADYSIRSVYCDGKPFFMSKFKPALAQKEISIDYHLMLLTGSGLKEINDELTKWRLSADGCISSVEASALSIDLQQRNRSNFIVIDLGATETSFAAWSHGKLKNFGAVQCGGRDITEDIMAKFNVGYQDAEILKANFDFHCINDPSLNMAVRFLSNVIGSGSVVTNSELTKVVLHSYHKILTQLQIKIKNNSLNIKDYPIIFLTGGGSALLGGCDLVSNFFGINAEVGRPRIPNGVDIPQEFRTLLGACYYLKDKIKRHKHYIKINRIKSLFAKLTCFFYDFF